MLEVVNVVSSGSLGVELNLARAAKDIGPKAEYDPDNYHGIYLRLGESVPLITVYRAGKYIITGANSEPEAYKVREQFLDLLTENEMIPTSGDNWFQVQNFVCTAELGESLNLNSLTIGLGLERTEYEPEQFPGLIYRPSGANSVALLFTSGRVVITGNSSLSAAEKTFTILRSEVMDLLAVE